MLPGLGQRVAEQQPADPLPHALGQDPEVIDLERARVVAAARDDKKPHTYQAAAGYCESGRPVVLPVAAAAGVDIHRPQSAISVRAISLSVFGHRISLSSLFGDSGRRDGFGKNNAGHFLD